MSKRRKHERGPLTPKRGPLTVKDVATSFSKNDANVMWQVQGDLERESGVKARLLLNGGWLATHRVASSDFAQLLNVMADCVKIAVSRTCSLAVYPIGIADDGTMFMQSDEPMVKATAALDFTNFGAERLGVAVNCVNPQPLTFQVAVGPFFELLQNARDAALRMNR